MSRFGPWLEHTGGGSIQLTRFSDLSLRLLLYLASKPEPGGALVTARAVSEIFDVPYAHLVKVVHRLAKLELIVTTKGKGGGLRLARPSREILLGEVLRQTEPASPIINCNEPACPLRFDCLLRTALDRAYEQFFVTMDSYTLWDAAQTPSLQRLVTLTAGSR